jgi:hypothetical protein
MWLTRYELGKAKYRKLYTKDTKYIFKNKYANSVYVFDKDIICVISEVYYSDRPMKFRAHIKGNRLAITDEDLDVLKLKCMIRMNELNIIEGII